MDNDWRLPKYTYGYYGWYETRAISIEIYLTEKEKCNECNKELKEKSKCVIIFTVMEERKYSDISYLCLDCFSIYKEFFEKGHYNNLYEQLEEHIEDLSIEELPANRLSFLTKKARKKICKMIEKRWNSC